MDRLIAIRVFAEVARLGSFTAAAKRLEMSRTMATRHIAALEHWLDNRLLQRTTRRVTLTDAGEQFLRRSLQMLELIEQAEEESARDGKDLRGLLRMTSSISFGHAHLAAAIAAFLARHPKLKIDLDVRESALNLIDARIDLAIRITAEPDPGLIARPLARCESVLVAAPDYLAAHGVPKHPEALKAHRGLGYANFGKSTWRMTRKGECCEIGITNRFTANEATAILSAAIAGAGIALQPTYLVNPILARGELVRVLPQWQAPDLTIYAMYTSRRHLSPAVRALLDFLIERFKKTPW